MTKLRLGIVGCGAITEGAHLPAALTSDTVDLTALVDVSKVRLGHLNRQYGLSCLMATDVTEVMSQVDAVILAIPNALHASIGVKLLSSGIHVLCEKPLAVTAQECEELCLAARKGSAVLAVGYMTRFYPSTVLTKDLLDSGFLGEILSFGYEFGTEGGWAPLSGYNLKRETSGGGVLIISGSHFIDRMLYLFGKVRMVKYYDDSRGGVEANCILDVIGTVNDTDCPGMITLSKTHRLANALRITGERGVLMIREGQSLSVTFTPLGSNLSHEVTFPQSGGVGPEEDYYRVQLEDFVHAIQSRQEPRVNGESGAASAALIEQCYSSVTPLEEKWCDTTLSQLMPALPA